IYENLQGAGNMKDQIEETLSCLKSLCDYLEIRVEDFEKTQISMRGPKVEMLQEAFELGGCARAYHKGGVGFVSFNNLDDMEVCAREAIDQAKIAGRSRTELAEVPVIRDDVDADIIHDCRSVSLSKKLDILKAYNEQILSYHPNIVTSGVRYSDGFKILYFGNSEGTLIRQERMDVGCNLSARSARNGMTQMAYTSVGSSNDFHVLLGLENRISESCRIALELLDAPNVKAGKYITVCDPHLSGTFIHEAFGHSSEAEKVYENKRLLEMMAIGTKFGQPILNVYDAGNTRGSRGYITYDEEGVRAGKTDLITEGKLVGRLHTRETAGKLKESPTGNGRAVDYRFPPVPRMRNTCIAPGNSSFEEMIDGIKLGVYAIDAFGGQSEEMFTFTAGRGYMIRNGKLAEMVKNVTLSGNLFTTLNNIDMIGNDFHQIESGGGCGKGDGRTFQFPLPVGEGSPHIRIRDIVIGGQ
ncbi:TldD/PmbA family protein, partial [bacterium]|nr:TldD/PmbA family protein [candidate division CSSED10-310 bacterium]